MFEEIEENIRQIFSTVNRKIVFVRFNPRRDWKIILVLSTVITLILILFDVYVFWKVNTGETTLNNGESTVVTINRTLLHDVLASYQEKEREHLELKEFAPIVVDPAL